ncbi:MAG: hypothetical protein IJA67_00210 [Oscillospiraceae bacterium]|nr:hypothetical protein [Oscillospiraceae bacterium]
MPKKLILTIFVACILYCITGCSALYSNSYYSEQDFQGNEKIDLDADVQVVQNYSELRRLVFGMVNSHTETKELLFSGYTGNAVSDIASVCNAVKNESSFGAYCVDYISYDLRQIVSSYEAVISISYLYTAEELQILQTTSNLDSFAELLAQALEQGDTKLVVRVNNGIADAESVNELMEHTARSHPLQISYIPKFNVRIFDGNTSQKLYDVSIQYDVNLDNGERLQAMNGVLSSMIPEAAEAGWEKRIAIAAERLSGHCTYTVDGGDTAYEALLDSAANSQGIACAFKALCDRMGLECLVVDGSLEKQAHFWNIIKIEDAYYHMDISLLDNLGGERSLFLRDAEKQVNCWWDQSEYPACDGTLTYSSVILSE